MNNRLLLLRYDVESGDAEKMAGFLDTLVAVHRDHDLPVTLFCTGGALEAREAEFRAFREATQSDPLFEVGDHSYSHVGVGYAVGKPVDVLRADYVRSLDAHERILGQRPDSLSLCGTGGIDGDRLSGFDATAKARKELAMLADLGFGRVNTFLTACDESQDFTDYAALGFPAISGFPSGASDTWWLWQAEAGSDFLAPLRAEIDQRSAAGVPMPVILHDWVTWNHAPDRLFTHVVELADYARKHGYELRTHGDAVREWRQRESNIS